MAIPTIPIINSIFVIGLSICLTLSASAQNKAEADDPSFEQLASPDLGGGNSKRFKPKDWLEIETKVKITKILPIPKDGYIDTLTVKWYVVVKGQDRKNYLIQKDVEHVNIPINEEFFVSAYLSPTTLKRITGKDGAGKNDLEAVGGDIFYNGQRLAFFSHGAKDGWWARPMPSVTSTNKFPLLNKDETPFKLFWYDRYAEIAPKK